MIADQLLIYVPVYLVCVYYLLLGVYPALGRQIEGCGKGRQMLPEAAQKGLKSCTWPSGHTVDHAAVDIQAYPLEVLYCFPFGTAKS